MTRELIRSWAGEYWQARHPYSAGGAYVNFLMNENEPRISASYGDNLDRLAAVKRRYDPDNLFHINQNILPKAA